MSTSTNNNAPVTVQMPDTVTVLVTKIGSSDIKNLGLEIPSKCEDLRQAIAQALINAGMNGDLGNLGISVNGKPVADGKSAEVKERDQVVVAAKKMKGGTAN